MNLFIFTIEGRGKIINFLKNCDKAQLKRFFFIGTENILILDLSEF